MIEGKHNIVVSDAALAMLDAHVDFLARVSKSASTRLVEEILNDIELLSENPERYPAYESEFIPANRYRKMLTSKRYLVLYEIDGDSVYIDYIVDCRQDYGWMIL